MTVKLVMLKSGEDIIADVKEIKSVEQEVIGYFFHDPLVGMGEKMKLKEIVDDCQISNAQVRRGYRR